MASPRIPPQPPSPSRGEGTRESAAPTRPKTDEGDKEFNLRERKKDKGAAKDEGEKFDEILELIEKEKRKLLGQEGGVDVLMQQAATLKFVAEQMAAAGKEAISSVEAKVAMDNIAALIKQMVAQMQVGKVGETQIVSMDLKKGPEVPSFLVGSNVSLAMEGRTLSISFTNLPEAHTTTAVFIMESRKEELAQLVQSLQAKNITLGELRVGEHSIPIPKVEAPAAVFPGATAEGFREKEEEKGGGGGKQEGEGKKEGREKR